MYHHNKTRTRVLVFCGLILLVLACTCGPLNTITQVQSTIGAAQSTLDPILTEMAQEMTAGAPTAEAALATMNAGASELQATVTAAAGGIAVPGVEFRQWAVGATATSQYQDVDWSATQAAGAPNVTECGDNVSAWAAESTDSFAALTLTYAIPVVPSSIEIHQTYNPGSIVKVEVVDEAGVSSTVYQAQPAVIDQCPYVQVVPVTGVTARVATVIITVDQSVINNWDEIDAVELVGIP